MGVGDPNKIKKLNPKEKLFVEAYYGDEVEAAKMAGYSGDENYLKRKANALLLSPHIIQAIKDRSKYVADTKKAVADRAERQEIWTAILRNQDPHRKEEVDENGVPIPEGNIPLPIRLKASELLGKSEADFVDKVDMTTNVTLSDIVLGAYSKSDKTLEDIEAEYRLMKEQGNKPPMPELIEDEIPTKLDELI